MTDTTQHHSQQSTPPPLPDHAGSIPVLRYDRREHACLGVSYHCVKPVTIDRARIENLVLGWVLCTLVEFTCSFLCFEAVVEHLYH